MANNLDTKFNKIDERFGRLEETNIKILSVLESLQITVTNIQSEMATKSELNVLRSDMLEFKETTQEQFEFLIENAATKTELNQAIAKLEAKMVTKEDLARAITPLATKEELQQIRSVMATKEDLLHFTDRFDAKFADLKYEIVQGIRNADKKFLKFAL